MSELSKEQEAAAVRYLGGDLSREQEKALRLYSDGESIASFSCDACGKVDEFDLPELPPRCPVCGTRDSLVVQAI